MDDGVGLNKAERFLLRLGDNTSYLRMDTINRDEIKQYFYLLEDGLTECNL